MNTQSRDYVLFLVLISNEASLSSHCCARQKAAHSQGRSCCLFTSTSLSRAKLSVECGEHGCLQQIPRCVCVCVCARVFEHLHMFASSRGIKICLTVFANCKERALMSTLISAAPNCRYKWKRPFYIYAKTLANKWKPGLQQTIIYLFIFNRLKSIIFLK